MEQLSLFNANEGFHFPENLLEYHSRFLARADCSELLAQLVQEVPWKQPAIQMYAKTLLTPRLTAWYGDSGKSYQFSGTKFNPIPWTKELFLLKEKIKAATGISFNSVLLNYYRNGNDSVAWHSDNERELGKDPHIASLSIGQSRRFEFRHARDHSRKYGLTLENGSLLIMKGDLQHHWEHRIPKSKKETAARINLTFRSII